VSVKIPKRETKRELCAVLNRLREVNLTTEEGVCDFLLINRELFIGYAPSEGRPERDGK